VQVYILAAVVNAYLEIDAINHEFISGIITLTPESGKSVNEYYDYSYYCRIRGINCIQVNSYSFNSEDDRKKIEDLDVDLLLVLGWQRIIPKWLIEKCNIGAVGVHGSPWGITQGRGRSPQNWSLIMGCRSFSVSIFWIDVGADSGRIINSDTFEYTDTDTIETSYIKCALLVAQMINCLLESNICEKKGENQTGKAFYLPKRIADDGEIDWNRENYEIYNFIRALSKPYPGAFSRMNEKRIIFWRATPINVCGIYESKENGEVVKVFPNKKLLVKCKDGFLLIDEYEVEEEEPQEHVVFSSVDFKEQMKRIIERHYQSSSDEINPHIIHLLDE